MVRLIFADGRTAHSRSTVTGPHGQDSEIMGLWTDKYPEANDVSVFSSVVIGACRCSDCVPDCAPHADFKGISAISGKPRDFYDLNLPIFIA
jgi:hypothetical protein